MGFFAGLVSFFVLFRLTGWITEGKVFGTNAFCGTAAAAAMFILVGIMHFVKKEKLEAMIPPRLKRYARPLNIGSGILEIVLGAGLLFPAMREASAWGLVVLLVLVFPANIHVARQRPNTYTISRLFFQPVYMAWLLYFCLRLPRFA